MAKRKEKPLTCTVEVTPDFSARLTRALVDIYYRRKECAKIEGKAPEEAEPELGQEQGDVTT